MMNVKEIETNQAEDGVEAYINARVRHFHAVNENPEFFQDRDHLAKVDEVTSIVKNFFKVHNGIYVTARPNRGKPFTAVKVQQPLFPNTLSHYEKQARYYKPLNDLGVEIVHAKGTNSWIFRVK